MYSPCFDLCKLRLHLFHLQFLQVVVLGRRWVVLPSASLWLISHLSGCKDILGLLDGPPFQKCIMLLGPYLDEGGRWRVFVPVDGLHAGGDDIHFRFVVSSPSIRSRALEYIHVANAKLGQTSLAGVKRLTSGIDQGIFASGGVANVGVGIPAAIVDLQDITAALPPAHWVCRSNHHAIKKFRYVGRFIFVYQTDTFSWIENMDELVTA